MARFRYTLCRQKRAQPPFAVVKNRERLLLQDAGVMMPRSICMSAAIDRTYMPLRAIALNR